MNHKIIESLSKKGIYIEDEFLSKESLNSINSYFDNQLNHFSEARVGLGKAKIRDEKIRGDYSLWIDSIHPPKEFESIISFLNSLKFEVNQSLFLGIKEYECHLAYYPPGKFYKKHLDQFSNDSSRTLTFIFYVHEAWANNDGGELVIYDKNGIVVDKIIPTPGKMVLFLSSDFPHEVLPGNRERRSFTGWMHNKIIN
jgi:SM-20-related protein